MAKLHGKWVAVAVGAVLAALVLSALIVAGSSPPNVDDGFIVLVYAKHFAQSGRIYWNAEDGAVDGFTSMLDMLLKALSARLFPADLVRNAHVLALGSYFASVALGGGFAFAALRGDGSFRARASMASLVALTFGANVALAYATSFCLEGPLYACVALASTGVLVLGDFRRHAWRRTLSGLWILLALVRPEGFGLVLAQMVLFRQRCRRTWPIAVAGGVLLAYLVWHRSYFGAWAPNTFYAKASDSRAQEIADGVRYVLSYGGSGVAAAILSALVFGLPLLAFVRSGWVDDAARARFVPAAAVAWLAGVEVIVEGGDSYPGGRFVAVPIALGTLAAGVALAGLRRPLKLAVAAALAASCVAAYSRGTSHLDVRVARIARWPTRLEDYACETAVGHALAMRVHTVAQTDFQRLKFYEDGLRVIDLDGLNDRELAHAPAPGATRFGKGGAALGPASHAEVLELGVLAIRREPMAPFSTDEIAFDEDVAKKFIGYPIPEAAREGLLTEYVPISLPTCGAYLNVFARKDVATRFADVARIGVATHR